MDSQYSSGGSRPSDKGAPGHPDPEKRGGGAVSPPNFSALGASVWSQNNRGAGPPGPSPEGATATEVNAKVRSIWLGIGQILCFSLSYYTEAVYRKLPLISPPQKVIGLSTCKNKKNAPGYKLFPDKSPLLACVEINLIFLRRFEA